MAGRTRLRRPSGATVLAALAIFIAGTGTATAAGSLVTIQDGTTTATARVIGNRLQVGGEVVARPASGATLFTAIGEAFSGSPALTCTPVYTPPTGQAANLQGFEVTAYSIGAPSNVARVFVSKADNPCGFSGTSKLVGLVAPGPSPATVVRQFQAGVGVPQGYGVYVNQFSTSGTRNSFTIALDGYLVPASQVPAFSSSSSAREAAPPPGAATSP